MSASSSVLDVAVLGTAATYRQLIADAAAAASSHNTQPWRFHLEADAARIAILPDHARRCPVVDPDDHHLWASLGCAAENLRISAAAHGIAAHATYSGGPPRGGLLVTLSRSAGRIPVLAAAIAERQCTRGPYDGRPVPSCDIDDLADAATSQSGNVIVITDPRRMRQVAEYVADANRQQLHDAAFVRELMAWVRFTRAEAERTRDGLWSRAAGRPEVPRWLAAPFIRVLFSARTQSRLDRVRIASSSGLAVFTSHADDVHAWIAAGQRYERFALEATRLGIRQAFVNQPVEVPAVRGQFARWLGLTRGRVDFIVRFGYGPTLPKSLRRRVDDIVD
jgi:hypothetical protein